MLKPELNPFPFDKRYDKRNNSVLSRHLRFQQMSNSTYSTQVLSKHPITPSARPSRTPSLLIALSFAYSFSRPRYNQRIMPPRLRISVFRSMWPVKASIIDHKTSCDPKNADGTSRMGFPFCSCFFSCYPGYMVWGGYGYGETAVEAFATLIGKRARWTSQ